MIIDTSAWRTVVVQRRWFRPHSHRCQFEAISVLVCSRSWIKPAPFDHDWVSLIAMNARTALLRRDQARFS
jgi:hypothetical protein